MKTYGIPVDSLTIDSHTGVEKYTKSLILEMMNQPLYRDERVILYSSAVVGEFDQLPYGWEWRIIKWPLSGWTHGRLSIEMIKNPPDVLFVPAHEIPLLHRRTKIVNTVHDVAFKLYSDSYSLGQNLRQNWSARRAVKVDHVITVSETTKSDLQNFYSIPDYRATTTYQAINPDDFNAEEFDVFKVLSKYDIKEGKYFISVGRIEQKKNIGFLINAFEKYREEGGLNHLVLAGKVGFGQDELKQKIQGSRFKDSIRVLGYVPDEDLPALLAGAIAYLFPSKYEGFGIPVLEAMASGIPILASDIPALREIAAEAALFAEVSNIECWTDNMLRISGDNQLRADLIQKGTERLKDFSWKKTARETWKVLRSV